MHISFPPIPRATELTSLITVFLCALCASSVTSAVNLYAFASALAFLRI